MCPCESTLKCTYIIMQIECSIKMNSTAVCTAVKPEKMRWIEVKVIKLTPITLSVFLNLSLFLIASLRIYSFYIRFIAIFRFQ